MAPLPQKLEVKETTDVKRKNAHLPQRMSHQLPTTGDWLKKRYIVNNYILLDNIGSGSYGEVRLCKDRTSDKLFAIKIISKDFLKKKKAGKNSETYFEDIKREIAIMKQLNHPNVLRLFEVLDDPNVNKMYLVLEYMKMGDLVNVLKNREEDTNANTAEVSAASASNVAPTTSTGTTAAATESISKGFTPLSDLEVWNICRQLVSGIKYLHKQNVVHGDIKPQNVRQSCATRSPSKTKLFDRIVLFCFPFPAFVCIFIIPDNTLMPLQHYFLSFFLSDLYIVQCSYWLGKTWYLKLPILAFRKCCRRVGRSLVTRRAHPPL